MANTQEKREFVRLNAEVSVKYEKLLGSEPNQKTISKNISAGGICIIMYEESDLGDILELELALPDNKAIRTTGQIAWINKFSIGEDTKTSQFDAGIQFINIAEEDMQTISKYIFSKTLRK